MTTSAIEPWHLTLQNDDSTNVGRAGTIDAMRDIAKLMQRDCCLGKIENDCSASEFLKATTGHPG